MQESLENYLLDYKFNKDKYKSIVHDIFIYISTLSGGASDSIHNHTHLIYTYLSKLIDNDVNTHSKDVFSKYINIILLTVGKEYLFNVLAYTFLILITHSNTDNTKKDSVISISISTEIARRLLKKYFLIEKLKLNALSFSKFIKSFEDENKELFSLILKDDTFYSRLGTKIMHVLNLSNLIDVKVTSVSVKEKRLDYYGLDKKIYKE